MKARESLRPIAANVAMLLNDRGASPEEAREYSATWSLQPGDRVAKQIDSQLRSSSPPYQHTYWQGQSSLRGTSAATHALPRAADGAGAPFRAGGRCVVRQSVSLVTLGVSDYGRAKAFYEALGWSGRLGGRGDSPSSRRTVSCSLLWSRAKLAADIGIADEAAVWGGIASGPQRWLARRGARGGRAGQKERRGSDARGGRGPSTGGYAGVFRDPRRPRLGDRRTTRGFSLQADGSVTLPS